MHGTFNGVRLKRITSIATKSNAGITLNSFRVLDGALPQLESVLHLNAAALLILSSRAIEGRIVHYAADLYAGYEITIEQTSAEI